MFTFSEEITGVFVKSLVKNSSAHLSKQIQVHDLIGMLFVYICSFNNVIKIAFLRKNEKSQKINHFLLLSLLLFILTNQENHFSGSERQKS